MSYDTPPPKKVPEPGFYYHYKHDEAKGLRHHAYYIEGVGAHSEDDCRPEDQFMQVYRPLYEDAAPYQNGKLFVLRPLPMFYEPVEWQGKTVERFTRITDASVIEELKKIKQEMYGDE
jgi:hypothetical protein